uniref:Tau95 domain-containing protein n=1 Tax=Heterorhabditis bacteriophora TaxID=37862 RepID=A0A1I7X998_HETBA
MPHGFTMTLPVSMEDTELFPKEDRLSLRLSNIPVDIYSFRQMRASLTRLWWSRLVISVRGYVINYMQSNEESLFHTDDAFISIHRFLAEMNSENQLAEQFILDVARVVTYPNIGETLLALASDHPTKNPFQQDVTKESFERVFGKANLITYRIANGQKCAYIIFVKVLCVLQERWKAEKERKKGIRFETDPEWQPDDRVVLFQEFFRGNRTWVLLDFDRYILAQWKPRGASIIFGDRFVEKKLRSGMRLCAYCGMIEQQVDEHLTSAS